MIKCPHLTPKSLYSNIGYLVADLYLDELHMFLESFYFLLCSLIEFSLNKQKKLHLGIFLFLFLCFFVNILLALINSPKIFYRFIANLLKYSSQSELNYFCISLE